MDHRYQSRPAPKEPRVRGGAWALLFGGLSVYNLIRAFFPRTEAELDYWWTFLLTSLIFLGIALAFFFLRRKDLAAHRRWQQELAAWRQDQIDLENQHHAQEMERLNRQLDLEKAELARIRAQAAAERREHPRSDQEKEEYKVAGTSYRQDAFERLRVEQVKLHGTVISSRCAETLDTIGLLRAHFIAFDVETTGLSPRKDRIIQIGAVLFDDQKAARRFTTFVNPHIHIPGAATAINHITDEMVADAPSENEAVNSLCSFLGDALAGETPLVAHNAPFDMSFLSEMLERNGISATISYVDTLNLSRQYLDDLPNYKQPTVAAALDIDVGTTHRADSDAETCGRILVSLIPAMQRNAEAVAERFARKQPTQEEKGICAYLVQMIQASGRDTSRLRFEKTGGAINVKNPYPFATFKLPKTKPLYFTIESKYYSACALDTVPVGKESDRSSAYKITIPNLDDIQALTPMLIAGFDATAEQLPYFYSHTYWVSQDAEVSFQIRDSEKESLIDQYRNYEAERIRVSAKKEQDKIHAAEEKRKQQELKRLAREQAVAEKAKKAETKAQMPAAALGRAICQYNDNMVLLREYESVTAAASAMGISSKSIRDAANGRQKHAAGYVWRYKDIE